MLVDETFIEIDIDEEHIAFILHNAVHEFAIGHRPRVVFQEGRDPDLLLDDPTEGFLLEMEEAVAVTCDVVDTAGDVDAHAQDAGFKFAEVRDEPPDDVGQRPQGAGCVFELERNVFADAQQMLLEIEQPDIDVVFLDVHTNEIAGIVHQTIDIRFPPARGVYLTVVADEVVLHQFTDQAGRLGHTDVEFPGDVHHRTTV